MQTLGESPTKPRGRRGGGSIFERNGRWVAVLDLGYQDGKRTRKEYWGRTRQEVQKRLTAAMHDHHQGLPISTNRQTVGQFLERWLQDTARHTLRPSTFRRYRELVRLHADPIIGKRQLTKLTAPQLANLYSTRLDAGLSPRTVQFLHAVLHRALRQALQWGLIARNPADAVQAPRPERKDIRPLDPGQVEKLLEAAEVDPLEALYVLALTTGMRLGELLGLTWPDIDLDAHRLQVRHTLTQGRNGGLELAEPKTDRSRRSIAMTELAAEALRRHRAKQLEARLGVGSAWADHDLVFCNAVGGPLDGRYVLKYAFRPLLARAGLPPIRFHDLRHSCATLLLAQGVHPRKVMDLLGHSTISLTMDTYSHILPNLQDEVAATMDALLKRRAT